MRLFNGHGTPVAATAKYHAGSFNLFTVFIFYTPLTEITRRHTKTTLGRLMCFLLCNPPRRMCGEQHNDIIFLQGDISQNPGQRGDPPPSCPVLSYAFRGTAPDGG